LLLAAGEPPGLSRRFGRQGQISLLAVRLLEVFSERAFMQTNSSRIRASLRIVLIVGPLLLATGCGSGTVDGKVLYQGKPVPGGTVTFIHPKKGSLSSVIGEDGSYQFVNIPPGEVQISVTAPVREPERKLPANLDWEKIKASHPPGFNEEELKRKMGYRPAPPSSAVSVSLPKKYADPTQSGLKYTITSGAQTHDIELE
jgi:hypothetical protein